MSHEVYRLGDPAALHKWAALPSSGQEVQFSLNILNYDPARAMKGLSKPLAAFVEEVALFFEPAGMPRIAGRIIGYLLVCDPPYRSATQLAEELGVSKGSVSTMARMLRTTGLVEPAPVPGERATHLRLCDDGFDAVFEHQIRQVSAFGQLANKGLALLGDAGPERTHRLRNLAAIYGFYEREMPRLLERWRAERARLIERVGEASRE